MRWMIDKASQHCKLDAKFTGGHGFTRHGQGEYVNLVNHTIHTNAIEGAFSVFKRGMKGSTSTAASSTCTATSPSSISGTPIE